MIRFEGRWVWSADDFRDKGSDFNSIIPSLFVWLDVSSVGVFPFPIQTCGYYVNRMTVCRGHATEKIYCVLLFSLMVMGESAVTLFASSLCRSRIAVTDQQPIESMLCNAIACDLDIQLYL